MRWHTFFLVAVFFFSSSAVGVGNATSGEIEFHTAAYSFPCRVKTPKEFAEANPDREIIEAIIRISATFDLHEKNINRVEYKLLFPESFEISDYLPKTTIGSEVVGQIQVGDQGMRKSMNIVSEDFGGKVSFQIPYVPIEGQKKSETKNETESEMRSSVQMSLMPPKELITAASTQDGGQTLHFKLQQYNQITLQGDKDFAFLAAVPKGWKGDCFRLECKAFLEGSGSAVAHRTLTIGLYKVGDLATKKQVEATARAAVQPTVIEESTAEGGAQTRPATNRNRTAPVFGPIPSNIGGYVGVYKYTDEIKGIVYINLKDDGTWEGTLSPSEEVIKKQSGTLGAAVANLVISGKMSADVNDLKIRARGSWTFTDRHLMVFVTAAEIRGVWQKPKGSEKALAIDDTVVKYDKANRILYADKGNLSPN